MLRTQPNERGAFSASLTASAQETEAALKQRRREMDQAWDGVDDGWEELERSMAEDGISRPSGSSEGTVRLNVGGSHVNFHRSVLEGKRGLSSSPAWTLGNLFEAQWDARVPRDADGRIVLDESPACVKHIVHALFTGAPDFETGLMADEKPYLPYVTGALGLSPIGVSTTGMSVEGGSMILRAGEIGRLTAALQGWCPGKPAGLQLLYRASRDGWSTRAFHAKCGDSASTVMLFRIDHGDNESVAGGYSSVSWSTNFLPSPTLFTFGTPLPLAMQRQPSKASPGAFIFMLKDGKDNAQGAFQPERWTIKPGGVYHSKAVSRHCLGSPGFGEYDLFLPFSSGPAPLSTNSNNYDVTPGSAILKLNGQVVSEVEMFQVSPEASAAPQRRDGLKEAFCTLLEETKIPPPPVESKDDTSNFGTLIAGSLMEERMAVHLAEAELSRANARATTCAIALAAVFGPDIAAGREDPVVELSVRGSRITTLRSTLQMCPDSAFAARFDDQKWPAVEKDLDERGMRKVDCSPSVFCKVLDVLRMRKRSGWIGAGAKRSRTDTASVAVKASDRAPFEEFVHMYFPGCESFVTDHVDFLPEPNATG